MLGGGNAGSKKKKKLNKTGKRRKKLLANLSNTHSSISDHYFAALVTVGAVGALDRCQLVKTGGS